MLNFRLSTPRRCWKAPVFKGHFSFTTDDVICFLFFKQVNEILAKSSVWSAFKDQKHDLFINESQTAGYLTGRVFSRHSLSLLLPANVPAAFLRLYSKHTRLGVECKPIFPLPLPNP